MRDGTISIDRREAYYDRVAGKIAKDPLGFYTRAERGRRIQSAIRPRNLTYLELQIIAAEYREFVEMEQAIFASWNPAVTS